MTYSTPTPVDAEDVPCRRDPERMFPISKHEQRERDEAAAKSVCNAGDKGRPCPLRDRCLAYALRHDVAGIWAGTTEDERAVIRQRNGVIPLPVVVTPYSLRAYEKRTA